MPANYIDTSAAFKNCFFNNIALHFLNNQAKLPNELFINPADGRLASELLARIPTNKDFNDYFQGIDNQTKNLNFSHAFPVDARTSVDQVTLLGILFRNHFKQILVNSNAQDQSAKGQKITEFKQAQFVKFKAMVANFNDLKGVLDEGQLDDMLGGELGPIYFSLKDKLPELASNIDDPNYLASFWQDEGWPKVCEGMGDLEQPIAPKEAQLYLQLLGLQGKITNKLAGNVTLVDAPAVGSQIANLPPIELALNTIGGHYYYTDRNESIFLAKYEKVLAHIKDKRDQILYVDGSSQEKLVAAQNAPFLSVCAELPPSVDYTVANKSLGILTNIDKGLQNIHDAQQLKQAKPIAGGQRGFFKINKDVGQRLQDAQQKLAEVEQTGSKHEIRVERSNVLERTQDDLQFKVQRVNKELLTSINQLSHMPDIQSSDNINMLEKMLTVHDKKIELLNIKYEQAQTNLEMLNHNFADADFLADVAPEQRVMLLQDYEHEIVNIAQNINDTKEQLSDCKQQLELAKSQHTDELAMPSGPILVK